MIQILIQIELRIYLTEKLHSLCVHPRTLIVPNGIDVQVGINAKINKRAEWNKAV